MTGTDLHIDRAGSGLTFTWESLGVQIALSRIKDNSRGCEAEWAFRKATEGHYRLMTSLKSNLSSGPARDTLVKRLKTLWVGPDWVTLVETVCVRAILELRKGEPTQVMVGDSPLIGESFLLNPMLYARHPTLLYGLGDTGKSFLTLYAALLLSVGGSQNGLAAAPHGVLYLDWELAYEEMDQRLAMLKAGHPELKAGSLGYRRMAIPLADALEEVQKTVQEQEASVVVIDSVALAAGAELERAETAIRFFNALRALNIPALLIGHTAKNSEEKSPFGSVFFYNLARSVWEVKKVQEADSHTSTVGLYHRKCNLGPRRSPLGFTMTIDQGACVIGQADLSADPELSRGMPLADQITALLKDGSARDSKVIASILDQKHDSVRRVLQRYKGTKWFKITGGQGDEWASLR